MRIISLGAGVQSTTLLLMALEKEIEADAAIFSNTMWEPKAVYEHLERLEEACRERDFPLHRVTAGSIRSDLLDRRDGRKASIPAYLLNLDGTPGQLRRQCTKEYKVRPIQRLLRTFGATAKRPVTLLLGISLDEVQRMKESRVKYAVHEYPLIDKRMTRGDCLNWLQARGYEQPVKSACIGCPFHSDRQWRELKARSPEDFADAVVVDAAIRTLPRIDGRVFLHRSLIPLSEVDFRNQQDHGQTEMFEDEQGCSPFTCGRPA